MCMRVYVWVEVMWVPKLWEGVADEGTQRLCLPWVWVRGCSPAPSLHARGLVAMDDVIAREAPQAA